MIVKNHKRLNRMGWGRPDEKGWCRACQIGYSKTDYRSLSIKGYVVKMSF
jgi:hypothetical protein